MMKMMMEVIGINEVWHESVIVRCFLAQNLCRKMHSIVSILKKHVLVILNDSNSYYIVSYLLIKFIS